MRVIKRCIKLIHHIRFFNDIRSLVLKHISITQVIEEVGDISKVWIRGDFAVGKDSGIIDMIIVGSHIDQDYFTSLIEKSENLVKRKNCYTITLDEKECFSNSEKVLLIWEK